MVQVTGYTISSIQEGYAKKEFTPQEIFDSYNKRIKEKNGDLNAYLSIFDDSRFTIHDSRAPLSGIPCAIKDNMLIDGMIATAGSKILENYVSAYDATVVRKLREAGVTFLGKTNLDEFAMGSSTENSAYGPTKNPLDLKRVPGGSSGGSTAAVAADLAPFALGSDTGSSIRLPAAFCGVVGLKPTYGRVSRFGLIAMASSLDQIGPITKNVRDAAMVLNIIAGHDEKDATTAKIDVPDFTKVLAKDIRNIRVGVLKEHFDDGLSGEVNERVQNAISQLKALGCEVSEISLPHTKYAVATYYLVVPCEISANLARFDGIRYGHSSTNTKTLLDTYIESREEGFGPEPKRRIMLGTYALSAGYYDAYYLKAQKVRALIKKDFDEAFKKMDVLVGPTSPTVAFKLGEKANDPLAMYLSDIYMVQVNLAGLPSISIPCGKGSESGMPVGFHIMGNSFREDTVLNVAHQLEQAMESSNT